MEKDKELFLSFYGDGPRWENIVRLLGYPKGYSYVRPFRLRDDWIQENLLNEMNNEQEIEKLKGQEVVLCMRFLDPKNMWSVLPLRKVQIEHIDPMPENQSVYFSMGSMYDFTEVKELSDICLEIDESERGEVGKALFFRANIVVPNEKFEVKNEDNAWIAYTNLIAKDSSLLINNNAKQGLYIRFHVLRSNEENEEVEGEVMCTSASVGQTRGAILSEGNSYELIFYHRIPCLIGQNKSIKQSQIDYRIPSGNLELNRWEEDLTSNYQKHVVTVSALRPSGTYEEINIGIPKEVEAEDGKTIIQVVKFQIPVKVKSAFVHRFKKTYGWLILISASLLANAVIGPQLINNPKPILFVSVGILAILSTIGIYNLQKGSHNK